MTSTEKWKQAEKDLEEFNKLAELIKEYPIRPFEVIKSLPYTIEKPAYYPCN